jgi:prepilin-type processing-associated H-X9-DG protein
MYEHELKRSRVGTAGAGDGHQGFTRLELLMILGVLGLLAALVPPALANNKQRSERLICLNNLRQIGQAFHEWGTEHAGRLPFRTPYCEGGLMPFGCDAGVFVPPWLVAGYQNNVWFQYLSLSNELRTPKILVCPSDTAKSAANHWGGSPGGLANPNYQNRAVSYIVALDAFPDDKDALVSGDRNIRPSSISGSCSSGVSPCRTLIFGGPLTFGLTSAIHVDAGNFLFYDGRVEELSSQGFARRVSQSGGAHDSGAIHYIEP